LQLTFKHWRSGSEALFVCPAGDTVRVNEFEFARFSQGLGQPMTPAWLCFMLKYGCQAPIAANAHVSWRKQ